MTNPGGGYVAKLHPLREEIWKLYFFMIEEDMRTWCEVTDSNLLRIPHILSFTLLPFTLLGNGK